MRYVYLANLYDFEALVCFMGLVPYELLVPHLQESYVELEKAIRSLASFYSKAGPSAPLPEEVKSEILNDLVTAEKFL